MDTRSSERLYEPTARRRRQARQAGLVPTSPELAWALGLVALALVTRDSAARIGTTARAIRSYFEAATNLHTGADVWEPSRAVLGTMVSLAAPYLLVFALVVLFAGLVQTGFLFSWPRRWRPESERPAGRRLVFPGGWWLKMFTGVLKLGFACLVGWLVIRSHLPRIANGLAEPPQSMLEASLAMGTELAWKLGLGFLGFGIVDYLYQRHLYGKQLRLTRTEYREELRLEEGEPVARERRKRRFRELLQGEHRNSP